MKASFLAGLVLTALLIGCSGSGSERSVVPTITPSEVAQRMGQDTSIVLLDVRTSAEFRSESGHLRDALHIPVDSLQDHLYELAPFRSKTIIAYCRSGVRSARAQKFLAGHGYHAISMQGGIVRWNNEHLPVIKE